ncbi:TlpA family protein disulfide reductase [Streptosporangium sp. NPDC004379]|uniref:TlpA family protein disulfide reductase n=1 Tax=Streptosporangium sp. NPDC004379 TaxID=3366189 RepID=UPI0036973C04
MIRYRAVAAAVSAALLTGACGAGGGDEAGGPVRSDAPLSAPATSPAASVTSPASASPATGSPSPTGSPAAVPAALAFRAVTLGGERFEGASLAGRPVVFWFWAPWCPKCLSDAPAVRAAAEKHPDVAFVGVAGLDAEPAMKEFVRRTGTGTIVQLSDAGGAVWTRLGVTQQSTFVFMRPDGSTEKVPGPLGADGLNRQVGKLRAG